MSWSESDQPGQTWVVLEDEDGAFNVTVVLGFGVIFLLVASAILCGVNSVCRRRRGEEDPLSGSEVDSSEVMLAQSEGLLNSQSEKEETGLCMNCLLIEMGEMVCYTDRCPDCGRVPPGRNIKQQLAVKRSVNKWKKKGPTSEAATTSSGAGEGRDKASSVVVAKQSRKSKVRNGNQYTDSNFV